MFDVNDDTDADVDSDVGVNVNVDVDVDGDVDVSTSQPFVTHVVANTTAASRTSHRESNKRRCTMPTTLAHTISTTGGDARSKTWGSKCKEYLENV